MGNSAAKEAREGSTPDAYRPASARRHSSASDVSGASSHRTFRSHSNHGHRDNHSGVVSSTRSSIRHALNLDEQVDGGYLVTHGVYTGPQDFKARIVRQLQVERRLAPFFKGVEDYDDSWTDAQLIAAVRGQPIPPDEPAESSVPVQPTQRARSKSNVESPTTAPGRRSRANTASSGSDKKPMEATLYRGAIECPICFLYYPPYLNSTRCCDQPICSECFVQIKRADPHVPEHENESNQYDLRSSTPFGMIELISEPASCPYCTEPDFGVTYQPPPFRTGLSSSPGAALRATLSRHSSSTASAASLNNSSTASVSSGTSQPGITATKRRQTLPSSASEVVTTDRIRPDWALKLANANAHAARRAAAATALHSAAFLADTGDSSSGSTGFRQSSRDRLLPRPTGLDILISGGHPHAISTSPASPTRSGSRSSPGTSSSPSRRTRRMVDLEEMMVMEAIRISLLEDEARQQREREQAQRGSEVLKQRRASASASPAGTSPSSPQPTSAETATERDSASTTIPYSVLTEVEETASTSSASLISATSSAESDLPRQTRPLADTVTASSSSSSLTPASQGTPGFSFGSLTGTLMVDSSNNYMTNGSTADAKPAVDATKCDDAEQQKGKDRISDLKIEDTTAQHSGPPLQAA